jgi:hypothetical protein
MNQEEGIKSKRARGRDQEEQIKRNNLAPLCLLFVDSAYVNGQCREKCATGMLTHPSLKVFIPTNKQTRSISLFSWIPREIVDAPNST